MPVDYRNAMASAIAPRIARFSEWDDRGALAPGGYRERL